MIIGAFGLPRAGKSTFLTYIARRALQGKRLYVGYFRSKRYLGEFTPYERVYCNFPLEGCYKLDFDSLGKVDFSNCLIIMDEIMLDADAREWKKFSAYLRDFLALHGHYKCDIIYCSQGYADCDKHFRTLTELMLYIEKFGAFTRVRPIKKDWRIDGDINEGYHLSAPLSATYLYRKKYYKYFDSFEAPKLPDNPAQLWEGFHFQYELSRFERFRVSFNCFVSRAFERVKGFFSPADLGQTSTAQTVAKSIIQNDNIESDE